MKTCSLRPAMPVRHLAPQVLTAAALVFCSLLLAVAPASAEDGREYVVLLVDKSSSMRDNDPVDRRVVAAKLFGSLLGASEQAAVVAFSGGTSPRAELLQPFTSGRAALTKALDLTGNGQIPSFGNATDLLSGLKMAEAQIVGLSLSPADRAVVVVLTDGAPWPPEFGACDGSPDAKVDIYKQEIRSVASSIGQRAGIFVIGLYGGPQTSDPCLIPDGPLMEELAGAGHGRFVKAGTPDKVIDAYIDILVLTHQFRLKQVGANTPVDLTVPPQTRNLYVLAEGKDGVASVEIDGKNVPALASSVEGLQVIRVVSPPAGSGKILETAGRPLKVKSVLLELDYSVVLTEPAAGTQVPEGRPASLVARMVALSNNRPTGPVQDAQLARNSKASVVVFKDPIEPNSPEVARIPLSSPGGASLTGRWATPQVGSFVLVPELAGIQRQADAVHLSVYSNRLRIAEPAPGTEVAVASPVTVRGTVESSRASEVTVKVKSGDKTTLDTRVPLKDGAFQVTFEPSGRGEYTVTADLDGAIATSRVRAALDIMVEEPKSGQRFFPGDPIALRGSVKSPSPVPGVLVRLEDPAADPTEKEAGVRNWAFEATLAAPATAGSYALTVRRGDVRFSVPFIVEAARVAPPQPGPSGPDLLAIVAGLAGLIVVGLAVFYVPKLRARGVLKLPGLGPKIIVAGTLRGEGLVINPNHLGAIGKSRVTMSIDLDSDVALKASRTWAVLNAELSIVKGQSGRHRVRIENRSRPPIIMKIQGRGMPHPSQWRETLLEDGDTIIFDSAGVELALQYEAPQEGIRQGGRQEA